MDYLTVKQTSEKWGISERRVQILCSLGKIEGTVKHGWALAIPKNSEKPSDRRYKNNKADWKKLTIYI